MTEKKTLYYPVWVAPNRPVKGWSWGKPCNTPKEADEIVKTKFLAENAVVGCVVEMAGGEKRPMINRLKPPSARRIVEHWEGLLDATDSIAP